MAEVLLAVRDASADPKWHGAFEDLAFPFALYSGGAYEGWLRAAGMSVRACVCGCARAWHGHGRGHRHGNGHTRPLTRRNGSD